MMLGTTACVSHRAGVVTMHPKELEDFRTFCLPISVFDHRTATMPQQYVTVMLFQFPIVTISDATNNLYIAKNSDELVNTIISCLNAAQKESAKLLVFPELALAMPFEHRQKAMQALQAYARTNNAIIIAGTFYDDSRFSRVPVIGPDWTEHGYKYRPSPIEVSLTARKGMQDGKAVPILKSDLGNYAILTCIDMLSDEAQFAVRRLASSGEIDGIVNPCYNDSSWEFLIEANSLVRRHPIFAMIANVSSTNVTDHAKAYGHTALLCNLRGARGDNDLVNMLPDSIVECEGGAGEKKRKLPFDSVAGDIGLRPRSALVFDLNLFFRRFPNQTSAADQGYCPFRNLHIVDIN